MNIKKLLKISKKPEIFTRTDQEFWNDPYISKNMLEAHLDPEYDGASRSFETIDRSVKWLLEEILPSPDSEIKILDLGCGPGLYASRLARSGYIMTGIDFSERSINYARETAEKENLDIEYIYKNYLTIDYQEEFDVIMLIYYDLGALTNEERDLLLNKVYKALKPGGLFIFDVVSDKNRDENATGRTWEITDGGFWHPESYLALTETFLYEGNDTFLDQTIVMTESGETKLHRIYEHFYTRNSVTKLLDRQSFKDHKYYSDLTGKNYSSYSKTIALVTGK